MRWSELEFLEESAHVTSPPVYERAAGMDFGAGLLFRLHDLLDEEGSGPAFREREWRFVVASARCLVVRCVGQ